MNQHPTKGHLIFAGLAFLLPLCLYLSTLCPTVPVGDGGELICAAQGLGIAHPTGYPLYCLLGRIWVLLVPVDSIARRLNLMSAFFGALCALMVFFLIQRLARDRLGREQISASLVALTAALLLAFSSTLWSQSVQSEVYTLHAFLVAVLLLVMVFWRRSGDGRLAYLWAFLWGLSCAHHPSVFFLLGSAVYLLLSGWRSLRVPKRLPGMILLLLLGISLYLYLPLRSILDPRHDWGNPETIRAVYHHISGRQYQRFLLFGAPGEALRNLPHYLASLADQWGLGLLIAGLVGGMAQLRSRGSLFFLFVLAVLGNVFLACWYHIPDIEVYYLPSFIVLAIWMGCGLTAALKWLLSRNLATALVNTLAALLLLVAIYPLARNVGESSQRGAQIARDYGMNILTSVEPDAILFAAADNEAFPVLYLHDVEGVRSDVEFFDLGSTVESMGRFLGIDEVSDMGGPAHLRRLVVAQTSRPIYFVKEHMSMKTDPLQIEDLLLEPYGLVYRLRRDSTWIQGQPPPWPQYHGRAFQTSLDLPDDKAQMMVANYHLSWGEDRWVRGDSSGALEAFSVAREAIEKSDRAQIHNSMGVFFRRIGWLFGARLEFQRALSCSRINRYEESDIHVNLGNLLADLGRTDLARMQMQQALVVWPQSSVARFNLARLEANESLRLGRYDRAAEAFEKMVAQDPLNATVWYNLGLIYAHRLRRPVRAIECFRQYLKLAPQGDLAASARTELEHLERY